MSNEEVKGFIIPVPVVNPFAEYGLQITHPQDGSKVKAGEEHNIVVSATEESMFDAVKTVKITMFDHLGKVVTDFEGSWKDGRMEHPITMPATPGVYTMEAKVLGAFKRVNAISKINFEVTS
jgi:hypothetical protein